MQLAIGALIADAVGVVLHVLYCFAALGLFLYGLQSIWLTLSYLRNRPGLPDRKRAEFDESQLQSWPAVTIQLPIYNECHVVERLVAACAALDYPRNKLQIQILDDSTDETTGIARRVALLWRQRGTNISVIHRLNRAGFKAGALRAALPKADGDFIAIFDADFVPRPDFLRRTISTFYAPESEQVGFVQARWSHLNRGASPLTRAQALALDGHFVVEQQGRQNAGHPFGFNGSAGIWRRRCIEDPQVGGWHDDTLCEDLDLSYRAQLAGWTGRYQITVEAPAEVPPQLLGFKRQQFRWAKGSIQALRKLSTRVWTSSWQRQHRIAAIFHLGTYLVHPLLLLLLLVSLPLQLFDLQPFWPLAYLGLVSVGPPLLYAVSQHHLNQRRWLQRWLASFPLLTLLGTGLCLNNSLAVWQALRRQESPFLRTPKFEQSRRSDGWTHSRYALSSDSLVYGELFLALYALLTISVAISRGNLWPVPFLLIYLVGFSTMIALAWLQERAIVKHEPPSLAGGQFQTDDFVKSRGR